MQNDRRQGRDERLLGRLVENCPKQSRPNSGAYRSEARHIALSLVLRLRFTRSERAIGRDMFWENMSSGLLAAPLGKSPEVGPRSRWTIWMRIAPWAWICPVGRVSFVAAAAPPIPVGLAWALAVA